jgi:hypothetical protein
MASGDRKLQQRMDQLLEEGADPLRLEALERARTFKRSWIDMAEALMQVRATEAYQAWGYADLYAYCADELLIKRKTVDKLTGSLTAIKRHAPALLDAGDLDQPIPSYDAVDYFARAMGEGGDDSPPEHSPPKHSVEVLDELREAVFDEGRPVSAIRRQFNPVLYPKSDDQCALEALEKASAAARRVANLLHSIDGLSPRRVLEVEAALLALQQDLDRLIPGARERLDQLRDRAS